MKRKGNLFEQIVDIDNLRLADDNARRGKTRRRCIAAHDLHREERLAHLSAQLKAGTYRTSAYHTFSITRPKERVIYSLPYYPDRIVHHAIVQVLSPIWIRLFTRDTYSCIQGRGVTACARAVRHVLRSDVSGTLYCLKTDIRKYYPSIIHATMMQILERHIKCPRTLSLLYEIVHSAHGLPIGNYLSQYLSNVYLSYFDHWVKEELRVKHYFRYADDMVFLSPTKAELHALLQRVKHHLGHHLGLELNTNHQIYPVAESKADRHGRGIDFVGYVFFRRHTAMRRSIKQAMLRRAHTLSRAGIEGKSRARALSGWRGWAIHADARHLMHLHHI